MNKEQIRKAIIKDVNDYFSMWGTVHYVTIGSNIEQIINKHFGHDKN